MKTIDMPHARRVLAILAMLAAPFARAEEPVRPERLIVSFQPVNGTNVRGTVVFKRCGDGIMITASVGGLYPNHEHRLCVHEFGDLGSPDASSAGGVFRSKDERDGDLGILKADIDGNARLTVTVDHLSLGTGAAGILGRSVVVHTPRDTGKEPAGGAPERLAVGVIGIAFQGEPSTADEGGETSEPAE